jgi:hypothetical protein
MAKPPKKKAEVRAAYVKGEGSLRELAKKFRVGWTTITRWAAEGAWVEARQRTLEAAQTKADERAVESVAAMLARHRDVAATGLQAAADMLRQRIAEGDLTPSALDTLTGVLARMVPVERLAAGIERHKPAAVLPDSDGDVVEVEIDAPDDEGAEPVAPPKPVETVA